MVPPTVRRDGSARDAFVRAKWWGGGRQPDWQFADILHSILTGTPTEGRGVLLRDDSLGGAARWGDVGDGIYLKPPVDGRLEAGGHAMHTCDAAFPVRCKLQRLLYYLHDAHHLRLDVVDNTGRRKTLGRALATFRPAEIAIGTEVLGRRDVEVHDSSLRLIGHVTVSLTLAKPSAGGAARESAAAVAAAAAHGSAAGNEPTSDFVQNEMLAAAGLGERAAEMVDTRSWPRRPAQRGQDAPPAAAAPPGAALPPFSPLA